MATLEDQRRYRAVIGHFATGVAVITAHGPAGPAGMTANALCSLSLDPLLLLVCFDNTARTLSLVSAERRFAVNVLCAAQHELSGIFASKMAEQEKFEGVPYRLEHRVPLLAGALAWLVCDLRELHPGGDHTIGIGEVTHALHADDGTPLVWYGGRYSTIAQ
jgi:3-hydroxy-9,10-secoandrosta-1,3,5(10)-triene-9,17-dione monooxygenase reductase component